MNSFNYKIYTTFNTELESLWVKLQNLNFNYPFQLYHLNKYWYEKIGFHQKHNLYIIVYFNEKNIPIVLFPFVYKKSFLVYNIEFIGGDQFDYKNPLYISDLNTNAFKLIWESLLHLIKNFDSLTLAQIPSKIANGNRNIFLDLFNSSIISRTTLFKLQQEESYKNKDYNKVKNDVIRQTKRIKLIGNLEVNNPEKYDDFITTMQELIRQKRLQYKKTGVRDIFQNINVINFYTNSYYLPSDNQFQVALTSLTINDEIISAHWGLVYNNIFYYLLPSYSNDKFSVYSPGKILLFHFIEFFKEKGFNAIDLTIGSESYKKYLQTETIQIHSFNKNKITLRGIFFINKLKLFIFLKNNNFTRLIITNLRKNSKHIYKV